MAYELFAGAVPFADSEGPMAILLRHVNEPIPPADGREPERRPGRVELDRRPHRPRTRPPHPDRRARRWESLEDIAISLLGPRWLRDGRLNHVAAAHPAPARGLPRRCRRWCSRRYVAPAPLARRARPGVGRTTCHAAAAGDRPDSPLARPPRPRRLGPPEPHARRGAQVATITPRSPPTRSCPGAATIAGGRRRTCRRRLPRKPPPPPRDAAPAPKESTPRVPPIVIAAALVVALVIVAVCVLVA